MTSNLKDRNIKQYFMDVTYYAIPSNNSDYKLLILIGFNVEEKLSKLCMISIIRNENIETFSTILEYLKINFGFYPKIITTDCQKAEIIAVRKIFPDTKNIICYYHIIKRCVLHLPELKSKNKYLKNKAQDMLSNIKMLLFIDINSVDSFFEKIKHKYNSSVPKFIKYRL